MPTVLQETRGQWTAQQGSTLHWLTTVPRESIGARLVLMPAPFVTSSSMRLRFKSSLMAYTFGLQLLVAPWQGSARKYHCTPCPTTLRHRATPALETPIGAHTLLVRRRWVHCVVRFLGRRRVAAIALRD